jgi:phosphoserine phosphatase
MKKVAIIFDFDETLVEESTSAFVKNLGINVDEFWAKTVQKLIDEDWDPIPAYMFRILEYSFQKNTKIITKKSFIEFSKKLVYKPGVKELLPKLREKIYEMDSNVSIDFFIISSGIGEIIKNSEIAEEFTDIWASDFSYDKFGEIVFPKKVLSFTDKTRYIFQISKGLTGEKYRGKPYVVNEKMDETKYSIPIENIYGIIFLNK